MEVAAFTGWSIASVYADLTLPRYIALQRHWKRWPPLAVSAAALAGYKQPEDDKVSKVEQTESCTAEQWHELTSIFGAPTNG